MYRQTFVLYFFGGGICHVAVLVVCYPLAAVILRCLALQFVEWVLEWAHVLFFVLKIDTKRWSRCGTVKGWSTKWPVVSYTMLSTPSYLALAQIALLLLVDYRRVLFLVLKIDTKRWSRCGTVKGWSTKWPVVSYTMLSTPSYLALAQIALLLLVDYRRVLFLVLKIDTKRWSRCGTVKGWSTKWPVVSYTMLSTPSYLALAQIALLLLVDYRRVLFLVLKIDTKRWSRCGTVKGWSTKWPVVSYTMLSTPSYLALAQIALLLLVDYRRVLFLVLKIDTKRWSRCGTVKGWSTKWPVVSYTMLSTPSYLALAQIALLLLVDYRRVLFLVLKIDTKRWSRCGTVKGWSTKWPVVSYTMLSTPSYLALAQIALLLLVDYRRVLFLVLKIDTKRWSRCGTVKGWSTKWPVVSYTMLSTPSYLALAQIALLLLVDYRRVLFLVLKIDTKRWSRCGTVKGWSTKWPVVSYTMLSTPSYLALAQIALLLLVDYRRVLFLVLKIDTKRWSRCGTVKGWSTKWPVVSYTMLSTPSYLALAQIALLLLVDYRRVLFLVLKIDTKRWSRCGTVKGWSTKWPVVSYTMLSTPSYLGLAQIALLLLVDYRRVLFLVLKIDTKRWSRCGTVKGWSTKWPVVSYTMLSTPSYLAWPKLPSSSLWIIDVSCSLS